MWVDNAIGIMTKKNNKPKKNCKMDRHEMQNNDTYRITLCGRALVTVTFLFDKLIPIRGLFVLFFFFDYFAFSNGMIYVTR